MAYFDDNGEYVITKMDLSKDQELPEGFTKVNREEPIGHYRPGKDLKGEAFITNLENVNKKRVESGTNEVPLTKTTKIVGIKKGEDAS